jgi:hypothetical protein
MTPRQVLPVTMMFGRCALRSSTRALDNTRMVVALPDDQPFPQVGDEVSFEVRIAGAPAQGRGHVTEIAHIQEAGRREMVAFVDVTELVGAASEAIARAGFRERVVEYAQMHPDAGRILGASGNDQLRRMAPDTTPLVPREARWMDGTEPLPRSEQRERDRQSGEYHGMREGTPETGRTRPRARRHHWENEDRFRVRGS